MATFAELVVKIVADITDFESGVTRAVGVIDGIGAGISRLGPALGQASLALTAAGAAITAPLVFAVNAAADFEREMRNVNAVLKLNEADFKALGNSILSLAALKQAPVDLAKAMNVVAQAGFQGKEALDILRAASISATAGLTTVDKAVDALTIILIAYGKKAGTAAEVSDVLFKTVLAGRVTFKELNTQLGDFIGSAAQLGIPLKDLLAVFATLSLTKTPAEAATALRAIISGLTKPSKEMVALFKEWGVASAEAAVQQFGFLGVIEKLNTAIGGSTTTANALFTNIRASGGIIAVTAQNMSVLNGVVGQFGTTAGSATAAFNEQMKALKNQVDLLGTSLQALAVSVGSVLLPALNAIIQAILPVVQALTAFALANPQVTTGIVAFALAIGGLLTVAGPLLFILGSLATLSGLLGVGFGALVITFASIVGAIGLVVAAVVLLSSQWSNLGLAIRTIGADLSDFFSGLAAAAKGFAAGIIQSIQAMVSQSSAFIQSLIDKIKALIAALLSLPGTALERLRNFLSPGTTPPPVTTIPGSRGEFPSPGQTPPGATANVTIPLTLDGQIVSQTVLRFIDGQLQSYLAATPAS